MEIGTYVTESGLIEDIDIENRALILPLAYVPFSDIIELESGAFNQVYADPEVEPYAG